ncbi:MAG TPA: hypothetical protein PK002_16020, partial [Cellvibrio sp.]|nr:hypothetical protein [Cellvibrio sp.]
QRIAHNSQYLSAGSVAGNCAQSSVTSLRTIRNTYPQEVWPGHIPVDTKFRDASRAGVPPHLFDHSARGVDAYQSLFKFLLQKFSAEDARLAAGGV